VILDFSRTGQLAARTLLPALLSGLLLIASTESHAARIEGVEFSDRVTVADTELQLAGLAHLYYKIIFTGAVVGLYLQDPAQRDELLDGVPKRLEFVYFGSLDAGDFADAANESLSENLDPETLAKYRDQIDAFNDLYVDIEKNDRYAISHIPGRGLQLEHNGQVLGLVEGGEFANAYFRIWFGDKPFNRRLKTSLLSGDLP